MADPLITLTQAQCRNQAIECRLLADKAMADAHLEGRPFEIEI